MNLCFFNFKINKNNKKNKYSIFNLKIILLISLFYYKIN